LEQPVRRLFTKIKVGDVILARQGTKKLAAVGTVIRTAYFDPIKTRAAVGDWYYFGNHLDVQWHDSPRDKQFPDIAFSMATLSQNSEEKYRALVESKLP
jgi:restriction system protein